MLILSFKPKQPGFAKQNPSSDRFFSSVLEASKTELLDLIESETGRNGETAVEGIGKVPTYPWNILPDSQPRVFWSCCFFYLVGLGESLRYAPAVGFLSENWVLNS